MDALARHAAELSAVGPAFSATGQQVNSTWQQLAGVYHAPESGQLLAATGPVQTTSASVGEDIATVGSALASYATTVKQIQESLDALRVQAQDLVAEADADKDSEGTLEQVGEFFGIGGDDDDYAERSNELAGKVHAQIAAFYEAQRTCANAINALYGGVQYRANDGDEHQDPNEFGYTTEQLDGAFEQGQELPWGTYAETDTGIVGGIWDGAKMFVGDLGALIGRDPVTGEWSWSTAGNAWKGIGTFALAIGVYALPGGTGAILDQKFNDGRLGNVLLNAGKSLIAYDEWGKGDNARAGGMAAFNIVSAVVGTKGAGAALRGVGAGVQASRIGAISRAGTIMVRTGEFITRLPTTEGLIARISQHLPDLRLPHNIPDVNVPHHIDTPRIDAPRTDVPHIDTPSPGSVGDNLANANRVPDSGTRLTPDAPATPDAPRGPDVPPSPDGSAPETPGGHTSGDVPLGDRTPAGTTSDTPPSTVRDDTPHDGPGSGNGPGDAATGHHANTDHMPPPEPGNQSLETLVESRVERGSDGLIETIDGRPVNEYLHDVAGQRAEQYREARADGAVSRTDTGPVTSVAIDRVTGEVVESSNGSTNSVIPPGDLHPLLRERLEALREQGPYPAANKDGSVAIGSDGTPTTRMFPHPDNPLRHAEIKAVNELLWRRGPDVDASVFEQLRVDNHFPFGRSGVRSAPCCVNCHWLLTGTPSNAGRFTGYPPGHQNFRTE